jgi:HNH endonuclease
MAREIELTQGQVAIVDDEDYDWLSEWKWFALQDGRTFYACRQLPSTKKKKRMVWMHRQILGAESGQEVDHISGNGLDNRRSNLRMASHAENLSNQRRRAKVGTSVFKGVSWRPQQGKWLARIRHNGT